MPDYKNGKIYCLRSHQTEDIYIGSTTQQLSQRMTDHKKHYKGFLNKKYHYVSSYEIIKYTDAYIELICDCPCNSRNELHREEGKHIRNNNCVNKRIAGRTIKEYLIDNKEKINNYHIQYRTENKEKMKLRDKDYYEKNKEKILLQKKEYHQKNKDKLNKKYNCECGGKYTHQSKARHFKTKKHIKYLESL